MHIYYRASCTQKKPGVRPEFFSKLDGLKSITMAAEELSGYRFNLIFDGDADSDEVRELIAWAEDYGEIDMVDYKNNSKTFRYAYEQATLLPEDDIVYFVEDDYWHLRGSLVKLQAAFDELKADYVTLYDHPVRYATDYKFGLDLPSVKGTQIWIAGDHHWRTQESTCMTFAARVSTLREDKDIFWRYSETDVPNDREAFRRLQGLLCYEEGSRGRILIGPMPSLSTHCHLPWLAPCVNWEERVKKENE